MMKTSGNLPLAANQIISHLLVMDKDLWLLNVRYNRLKWDVIYMTFDWEQRVSEKW
jgi:hypothetical protein